MINNPQIIQQVGPIAKRWQPTQGSETLALLTHLKQLDDAAKQHLLTQSISILAKCIPPGNGPESDTGIVIGYVQSGKTMSFTTVTALARDNNFHIVIVLTGISTTLDNQSADRIRKELRLNSREDHKWIHYDNPKERLASEIQDELDNWHDPEVVDKKTILLTVMKNVSHLRNLGKMLGRLKLHDVTALIIDDEADQAGLNIQANNGLESSTYARILDIRSALPRHTYLQYTATPQAPLLISLIDMLSPTFVELLEPGADYTGGETFFVERPDLLVTIPPGELPTTNAAPANCPESLLEAMRLFFLGVAAAFVLKETSRNRSMMVHPASRTNVHRQYFVWVQELIKTWKDLLGLPPSNPDRQDLLKDFQASYVELKRTVKTLPSFAEIEKKLLSALRDTNAHEVNTNNGRRKTDTVDWSRKYGNVLVGGAALDRGFTVEGLTVTYMPRALARTPNADTVQQRARFFGYKRPFLEYCRVFLERGHQEGFEAYVEHERDIRKRLKEHNKTGQPLNLWKRAFFLDLTFQATRRDVLTLDYTKSTYVGEYFHPSAPHAANIIQNQGLVTSFKSTVKWTPDQNANWTQAQKHSYAVDVPLEDVLDNLLVDYNFAYQPDSRKYTGVLLQLQRFVEISKDKGVNPLCTVIDFDGFVRSRSLNGGLITSLWEGAAPGTGYPGDQRLCETYPGVRIQIHHLNLKEAGQPIASDVPTLAIYVPKNAGGEWWVQEA